MRRNTALLGLLAIGLLFLWLAPHKSPGQFSDSIGQRGVLRDWAWETPVGRLGYWMLFDFNISVDAREHILFLGPFGAVSFGPRGLFFNARPIVAIVWAAAIGLAACATARRNRLRKSTE